MERKEEAGEAKRRERKPPSLHVFNLGWLVGYVQWCCLLINDYYDNSPEQSSVGSKGWTLPCLISSGALSPVRLHFSCFQFGLSTCAALAIYITMNISCCCLFLYTGCKSSAMHVIFIDLFLRLHKCSECGWESSRHQICFFVNEMEQARVTVCLTPANANREDTGNVGERKEEG